MQLTSFGTSEDLGRVNASLVLRKVLAEGPLARAEIADRLGLRRATVTRVAARLLEIGVLREGEPNRSNPGRPTVPLELGGHDRVVLTAHFGTRELRVGSVNIRGEMLQESRRPYADPSPEAVADMAREGLATLAGELRGGETRVLGVGASIAGWVDPATGVVARFAPLGWTDVPFGRLLTDELELPHYFDQTVRGLALAERMIGAARGHQDLLMLWVGNVLGAAIVNEGVARQGPRGAAGSIAHFPVAEHGHACECGRTDCLQQLLTDGAILRDAIAAGIVRPSASIRTLVQVAADGDEAATTLMAERGAVLGRAAAAMSNLVNPPLVVVGGLVPTARGFMPAFTEAFERDGERAGEIEVAGSAFGDAAPTIASAAFLLDAFYRDPFAFSPA
ncbi:ROK family transcriptional regulator [Actinoplanes sp. LDG1-06]|uniref:ROK family transcriptional regulator n=1 Tax=Paractinoplanes ovalisporus TaxID=2810368 RepID=A0ABS2AJP3_9ACTN|nr:ROK family transcriptional regulator [Actinoplanes ovalisporus]MBM2619459.1 ROK family transcriptional regulator [Actinoplanes ovalisporus]